MKIKAHLDALEFSVAEINILKKKINADVFSNVYYCMILENNFSLYWHKRKKKQDLKSFKNVTWCIIWCIAFVHVYALL